MLAKKSAPCCDLLSFFELLIFTTTKDPFLTFMSKLWFAFILWTTDIYNNFMQVIQRLRQVVICFHSLNYWYLQQRNWIKTRTSNSCDLLSFFELLIFTTTDALEALYTQGLWFAFILWTTDIYNNKGLYSLKRNYVVICFHSLNYWYLQQLVKRYGITVYGCDLLSFFELLIFTTTSVYVSICQYVLWFAFILWTTDIYNNLAKNVAPLKTVVICFHSLNYWYLQQPA